MKRLLSFCLIGLLLLSACRSAERKELTREDRLKFFEFADAYRLDLLPDFDETSCPASGSTGEGAPFVELIDYRQETKGEKTLVTARYIEYSFPELQVLEDPKTHPHYEWAKETVVNGETEGFTVERITDLQFYLPQGEEDLQLVSKKTIE